MLSERKLMCFRTRTPHQKIFVLLGKTHWSTCTTVDLVTRSIPFGCSISTAKFHPARHVCNRGHCHQHQPQPSTIVYVWTTKSNNGMECTMVRYRMGVEVERWQDVTCCNWPATCTRVLEAINCNCKTDYSSNAAVVWSLVCTVPLHEGSAKVCCVAM